MTNHTIGLLPLVFLRNDERGDELLTLINDIADRQDNEEDVSSDITTFIATVAADTAALTQTFLPQPHALNTRPYDLYQGEGEEGLLICQNEDGHHVVILGSNDSAILVTRDQTGLIWIINNPPDSDFICLGKGITKDDLAERIVLPPNDAASLMHHRIDSHLTTDTAKRCTACHQDHAHG